MDNQENRIWPRIQQRVISYGMILAGGLGTLFGDHLPWHQSAAKELSIAIFVAGILASFVEPYFRNRFARDAFEAAYRYVLPKEFKDEIARIMRLQLLAETQVWTVRVEKLAEDKKHVLVTTSFEKRVVNKSNRPVEQQALYTVPVLGHKNGRVEILECSIETGDAREDKFTLKQGYDLKAETEKLTIRPKAWAKISGKATQYRRTTDLVFENFMTPALDPVIEVFLPDGFDHDVQFGTHDERTQAKYTNRYQLSGVYLPGQTMWVRWWPKNGAKGAT